MNKLIVGMFLMLLTTGAAHAASLQLQPGAYLGVTLGYADSQLQLRESGLQFDGLSITGASAGILAGYLAPAGAGAFGIEGFATLEDGDARIRFGSSQIHAEARESYGLTALAGAFVGSALLYARVGYARQRGKLSFSDGSYSESSRQTYKGPGAGVGLMAPLSDRLALRLSYMRWFYKEKFGFQPEQGRFDIGLTHSF